MRLSTFDEDPVIEYTCCTACISRNHEPGPRMYICAMYASSFSSFETRENIDLEGGGPVPRGLAKTLGNSTDRSDSLDDHVDEEDNSRVHGIDQIEPVRQMKFSILDRIIPGEIILKLYFFHHI